MPSYRHLSFGFFVLIKIRPEKKKIGTMPLRRITSCDHFDEGKMAPWPRADLALTVSAGDESCVVSLYNDRTFGT